MEHVTNRRVGMARRPYLSVCVTVALAAALTPSRPLAQEEPVVAPEAAQVMEAMNNLLSKQEAFMVRAYETIDEVTEGEQKLQFSAERQMLVKRPDRLSGQVDGDGVKRRAWYDGKTLTLLDIERNAYIVKEVPGTIQEMVDYLAEQEGVVVPLAELASGDLKAALLERVESGEYVGIGRVREKQCHHLAFTQQNIDWQVWVEQGDNPVPRKLVITYKRLAGEPQYTAEFEEWEFAPVYIPEVFTFVAPEGAQQIPFLSEEMKRWPKEWHKQSQTTWAPPAQGADDKKEGAE